VVQGFGNAGSIGAHLLDSAQAVLIAASDSTTALYHRHGLDIPKLIMHKQRTGTLKGFPGAETITPAELRATECEILIPAALENAITDQNADAVKTRIVAEAANGPVTPEADRILEGKGLFLIPDILCNAGGATVSYFEWVQDEQHVLGAGDEDCIRRSAQDSRGPQGGDEAGREHAGDLQGGGGE
jgi:glutamate dehydrogenase/leucine dehydrogenase